MDTFVNCIRSTLDTLFPVILVLPGLWAEDVSEIRNVKKKWSCLRSTFSPMRLMVLKFIHMVFTGDTLYMINPDAC